MLGMKVSLWKKNMVYKFICIVTLIFFWLSTGICQNVGIQIPNPESTLDINGNLSLRSTDLVIGEGNHLALDVNSNPFSNFRISGPSAPFSILLWQLQASD